MAFFTFVSIALAALTPPALAQTGGARLDFADNIRMVSCEPAATVPCFRMKLNIVDAQGNPLGVQLPPPDKLASSMTVRVEGQELNPFYASAQAGTSAVRGRVALVLVDISGSMNRVLSTGETRFDAAKVALTQFLGAFQNGSDHVAIVPFESHNVEPMIRAARFADSRDDALRQVNALPAPQPKNNTALYSAVSIGLDVLAEKAKSFGSGAVAPEALLIVMTDGANEILRGDDLGLLAGPAGLEEAGSKVQAAGIQAIGVGFGDPAQIDETALRRLSTRYYMAQDLETLKRIFTFARTLLNNRIQATFASPWPDRASLAGRSMHVSVRLKLPQGETLASGDKSWDTPQMGVPLFEGPCSPEELKAVIEHNAPVGGGWMSVLRPVLVFVGLGVLILVMWFWVPRLVWPEQYIGIVPGGARWAAQTSFGGRPSRPAPPGFDPAHQAARAPQRAPSEATVVRPRADFSKTRLEVRPDKEGKG